jgi:hypothetical protein
MLQQLTKMQHLPGYDSHNLLNDQKGEKHRMARTERDAALQILETDGAGFEIVVRIKEEE